MACVDELQEIGAGENYVMEPTLCGTWNLLFTTEKASCGRLAFCCMGAIA